MNESHPKYSDPQPKAVICTVIRELEVLKSPEEKKRGNLHSPEQNSADLHGMPEERLLKEATKEGEWRDEPGELRTWRACRAC